MKIAGQILPDKFYLILGHHERTTMLNNTFGAFNLINECTPSEMMTLDEAAMAIDDQTIAVLEITWDEPPRDVSAKACQAWWDKNHNTLEPGEAGEPLGVPQVVKWHCDREITDWTGESLDMAKRKPG